LPADLRDSSVRQVVPTRNATSSPKNASIPLILLGDRCNRYLHQQQAGTHAVVSSPPLKRHPVSQSKTFSSSRVVQSTQEPFADASLRNVRHRTSTSKSRSPSRFRAAYSNPLGLRGSRAAGGSSLCVVDVFTPVSAIDETGRQNTET